MNRQPDKTDVTPHTPSHIDYSNCRKSELIAIAAEQAQSLADMRAVLYRETDALREELRILQAENRALKDTLQPLQEKLAQTPESASDTLEEILLKEKLRPIVAKLLHKHRQETEALQHQLMALRQELAQEQEKHSEALLALARVEERCAALEAFDPGKEQVDPASGQMEYERALAEVVAKAARQEETVQALTRQLEDAAAQSRAQRAQAMEHLRTMRESFEHILRCFDPEETANKPVPHKVVPVFREKLMPFVREHN